MTSDEQEIYFYLKQWGRVFVSPAEVCRRASSRKRFLREPDWAKPVLMGMVKAGVVEMDAAGHCRLKPRQVRTQPKRYLCPQIAKILANSGKSFSDAVFVIEDDLPPEDEAASASWANR